MNRIAPIKTCLLLLAITTLIFLIYYQSVNGPFLHDDFPNLSKLGDHKGGNIEDNLLNFVFGNNSGILGRPVSMLTFFLNGQSWPAESYNFKLTNIILHLINGWLIFFLLVKLIVKFKSGITTNDRYLLSFVVTSIWLLHPLHVSTTLYTVQRMTQLSALFSLITLISFINFHSCLKEKNETKSFILPTLLIIISINLALFSKENAVLVFPIMYLINFYTKKTSNYNKLYNSWLTLITIIPLIVGTIIFSLKLPALLDGYHIRQFTLYERLLTESRIIIEYIQQILIPNYAKMSIYHDDFEISTSLFTPYSTIFSIVLLMSILGILLTKTNRIVKFFIAWFFIWHLLESTILPLELYYEHRNYLASLGPIFIVVYCLFIICQQISTKIKYVTTIMYMSILLLSTSILASKWSNAGLLHEQWLRNKPNSLSLRLNIISLLEQNKENKKLLGFIQQTKKNIIFKNDMDINLKLYVTECTLKKNTIQTLTHIKSILSIEANYNSSWFQSYTDLTSKIKSSSCSPSNIDQLHDVLAQIREYAPQKNRPIWLFNALFSHATVYSYYNNFSQAVNLLEQAYSIHQNEAVIFNLIKVNTQTNNFKNAQYWLEIGYKYNSTHLDSRKINEELNLLQTEMMSLRAANSIIN